MKSIRMHIQHTYIPIAWPINRMKEGEQPEIDHSQQRQILLQLIFCPDTL